MPLDYTLRGKRVTLERVGPKHVDFLIESFRDDGFWRHYRANQPRNLRREQLITGLQNEQKTTPEKLRKIEWVISLGTEADKAPVGLACLADFIPASRKAEMLIGIPDPGRRAGGVALEATLLLLDFTFNKARLNKLISYVYADNQSAQDNTLELGFTQEGLLREHVYNKAGNRFIDVYQNGLLEREFRVNKRISRLSGRLLGRDITVAPSPSEPGKSSDKDGWTINVSLDY